MAVAILTGHAPVYYGPVWWGSNLQILQDSDWNSAAYYLLCEALARQRYNIFGRLTVEPSTASVRDLCLFIRGTGLLYLCWMSVKGCIISLRLRCISWWALKKKKWSKHLVSHIQEQSLMRVFGPIWKKVKGEWRKLCTGVS